MLGTCYANASARRVPWNEKLPYYVAINHCCCVRTEESVTAAAAVSSRRREKVLIGALLQTLVRAARRVTGVENRKKK